MYVCVCVLASTYIIYIYSTTILQPNAIYQQLGLNCLQRYGKMIKRRMRGSRHEREWGGGHSLSPSLSVCLASVKFSNKCKLTTTTIAAATTAAAATGAMLPFAF